MSNLCAECNSSETSTGLGDTITCFRCGYHGDHKNAGRPQPNGYVAPSDEPADEPAAEASEEPADE